MRRHVRTVNVVCPVQQKKELNTATMTERIVVNGQEEELKVTVKASHAQTQTHA
jgi:hypothetical protein